MQTNVNRAEVRRMLGLRDDLHDRLTAALDLETTCAKSAASLTRLARDFAHANAHVESLCVALELSAVGLRNWAEAGCVC